MIHLQNISLRLSGEWVFQDLSWFVTEGSRVGLIGPNGSGKTTLLRLLTGEMEPDEGTIALPRQSSLGYLPQELTALSDMRVIDYLKKKTGLAALETELRHTEEALAEHSPENPFFNRSLERHDNALKEYSLLDGFSFLARAHTVLQGLGFAPEDALRKTSHFSGGWQMKILLSSLLLQQPDILLLDEPTNHLDTGNLEWLEDFLKGYQGTIVMVSHDRRFLDVLVTETAALQQKKIILYPGGYSKYVELLREHHLKQEKNARLQARFLEKERMNIDRFRYKASKASQVKSRVRRLEKMEQVEIEAEPEQIHLRFPECARSAHEVLSVQKVWKGYGAQPVLKDVTFSLFRGEKAALVGLNGAGKSTLARLIGGIEKPDDGRISLGEKVKIAYFFQESARNLDFNRTVWEEVNQYNLSMSEAMKRKLLGAFLFSGDSILKSISVLSGGEKARLSLLKLLLQNTNFLVLDEPTNHLDIPTCELFQQALEEYTGTLLIISHDRYLLDRVVSRVLEIRHGNILDYPGSYSYYLRKRSEMGTDESPREPQTSKTSPLSRERAEKRAEAERRNRIYREKQAIQEKLDPLEQTMLLLEQQKEEKETLLGNPEVLKDSGRVSRLMVDLKEIGQKQEVVLREWETLLELLEGVEMD